MPRLGQKAKKKRKEIDWSSDEYFDKNRAMIYIEHTNECPIFQVKAEEFATYLRTEIPDRGFQLVRNKDGKQEPRDGAFEIDFAQNARTSVHQLWTGIAKGPPRRDKFPLNFELLLPEVRKILKKFYADRIREEDLDDERQNRTDDDEQTPDRTVTS